MQNSTIAYKQLGWYNKNAQGTGNFVLEYRYLFEFNQSPSQPLAIQSLCFQLTF